MQSKTKKPTKNNLLSDLSQFHGKVESRIRWANGFLMVPALFAIAYHATTHGGGEAMKAIGWGWIAAGVLSSTLATKILEKRISKTVVLHKSGIEDEINNLRSLDKNTVYVLYLISKQDPSLGSLIKQKIKELHGSGSVKQNARSLTELYELLGQYHG